MPQHDSCSKQLLMKTSWWWRWHWWWWCGVASTTVWDVTKSWFLTSPMLRLFRRWHSDISSTADKVSDGRSPVDISWRRRLRRNRHVTLSIMISTTSLDFQVIDDGHCQVTAGVVASHVLSFYLKAEKRKFICFLLMYDTQMWIDFTKSVSLLWEYIGQTQQA